MAFVGALLPLVKVWVVHGQMGVLPATFFMQEIFWSETILAVVTLRNGFEL